MRTKPNSTARLAAMASHIHQPADRAEHQRLPAESSIVRDGASQVDLYVGIARHRRHQPPGGERNADPERHVDAEDAAPAQAGKVQRHEPAAKHESDSGTQANRNGEDGEGTGA
jgi:hypothetical protein